MSKSTHTEEPVVAPMPVSALPVEPAKTHQIAEFQHNRPLTHCRADLSGRFVFAGAEDLNVHRWNLQTGKKTTLTGHESWVRSIDFSPDGRWLAYVSDESGREEIYVRPFPDIDAGRWQVSTGGGTQPLWARNGRELFYRNGSQMMAVDITAEPTFNPGNPRLLFRGEYMSAPNPGANYDVTSDGQRFLMVQTTESEQAPTQINVALNWFE